MVGHFLLFIDRSYPPFFILRRSLVFSLGTSLDLEEVGHALNCIMGQYYNMLRFTPEEVGHAPNCIMVEAINQSGARI